MNKPIVTNDNMMFFTQQYVDENGKPVLQTPITHPYSYDAYVIWGRKTNNSGSVYSDRLYQWDSQKYNELCRLIWNNESQYFDQRNPSDIQTFLRRYNDNEQIVLTMIMKCCNVSSGYPIWIFFYRENN